MSVAPVVAPPVAEAPVVTTGKEPRHFVDGRSGF